MSESPEQAVIAVFEDAGTAETAIHELMGWDKANDDVKLGAIGLLTRAGGTWGEPEVKTKNFSSRNTGKGAKVGMGLGVLAAVLSGGLTLVPGVVGGAVAGGAVGALSHKALGLTEDERRSLANDLEVGHAAVLVMCDEGEVQATTEYLRGLGGTPRAYAVNQAELAAAADATGAAPSSSA